MTIPWMRFVALGDSLTEGIGDPVKGSLRGWAVLLAGALKEIKPELRFWNLAKRSLTTTEVHESQLEKALELEPDLVSVVTGMNDVMARDFDAKAFRADLDALVRPLVDNGKTVLMGTLPRTLPLLRLMPKRASNPIRQRLNDVSDTVIEVAAAHGAVCVDAPPEWRYTMAECSIDGCHPNARGHAHIAELALAALGERVGIGVASLEATGPSWLIGSMGHLRWLASQGYLQVPAMIARLRGRNVAPPATSESSDSS